MNFVFWFLIILCLMGVWFALSPLFGYIGNYFLNIKNTINKEKEDK